MAVSVETLSAEAVTTLSACKHEPTWMRDRRLAAWRQSQELSLPLGTEEEWRRTDLRGLELEHYLPLPPQAAAVQSRRRCQSSSGNTSLCQRHLSVVWWCIKMAQRSGRCWMTP